MKKNIFSILSVGILVFSTANMQAQQTKKEKTSLISDEDEGPLMYKFEPNFLTAVEMRQEEIKKSRAIIDTMQISDRKRRRLLRDLHKNSNAVPMSKTSIADTKFEDDSDLEN